MSTLTIPHRDMQAIFRKALGHFCSGVVIVTAVHDGHPVGMTCQSFFSVSVNPPLVAFSPAANSGTYGNIRRADAFCINVLAEDQHELSAKFARSGTDKFQGVDWKGGETGAPVLDGVLTWIECRPHEEHSAGDHFIASGEVIALGQQRSAAPLLYFNGAYSQLRTANAANN
jgi:3-hydroxy-9,10-secoandrosta-1,3,5(10)-triene-9,17-dione monooxygenase reductase component